MPTLDQHLRYQISDLSEACLRYWELRGIAPKHRQEMQLELEHHFLQATLDGKTPKAVIGPNPLAFAETWAREMHPQVLRGSASLLPGLIYALSVVSTTALFQQLFAHTPSFTFTLFALYLLAGSGLMALLFPLQGFLALHLKIRATRTVLLATILILLALLLRTAGMSINWNMQLFTWEWPFTFLLLLLTTIVSCLELWRRTSQKPTSSSRRIKFGHSLITLAGNVVLFDVFLLLSSILMLNICTLADKIF